jgi:carboxylesterase type B
MCVCLVSFKNRENQELIWIIDSVLFVLTTGIPYAEKPGMFQSPVPSAPWLGVRKAKKFGTECLQLSPPKLMRVVGSEDCLYLNIYTRKLPDYADMESNSLLPVIFMIHGGSYYFGSGSEVGPAYLLNHEIILVTFNYR